MEPEEEEITTRAARRNPYAFSSPRVRSASFQFAFFFLPRRKRDRDIGDIGQGKRDAYLGAVRYREAAARGCSVTHSPMSLALTNTQTQGHKGRRTSNWWIGEMGFWGSFVKRFKHV